MKISKLICTLTLSASIMLSACGGEADGDETTSADGTAAVEIASVEYASLFKGHKLTMINVWATFCGPCIDEMPDLGEIASEYADKGLQIVGIPVDVLSQDGSISEEMVATAKEIVATTGANYLHILPAEDNYALLAQSMYVPTTFFFDEEGNQLGESYVGSRSKTDWTAIIDELLESQS